MRKSDLERIERHFTLCSREFLEHIAAKSKKPEIRKIAQKIFRRPRVSDIKMDKYGSFVWHAIDDEKDVHQLSKEMESEFPKMEKSLSRLIKFLEIMKDNNLIYWKGEKRK